MPWQNMTKLLFERLDEVLGPSNSSTTAPGPPCLGALLPRPRAPGNHADYAEPSASLAGRSTGASDSPPSGGSLPGALSSPALPDLQSVLGHVLGSSLPRDEQSGDCRASNISTGPGDTPEREQARGLLIDVLTQQSHSLLNQVRRLQEEQLHMQTQLELFQQQANALCQSEGIRPK